MNKIFFKAEGSGQPIVLIHGFCETSEIWSGFSNSLAASNNKVYSIDLPGFGNSPLPGTPFTIDQIAQQVLDWMEESKIINPILIGHSLGGYVALSIGAQAEEKIKGLVLFHSTAHPDSEERKANRNKVIEFVKTHGVDLYVDTFVPGLFHNKNHTAISYADEIARRTPIETLVNYAIAMRDRPSRVEFLKLFKKTFLVLGGQWDTIIPPEVTLQHSELNSFGYSLLLPEAAHMGMFEQREKALKFLNEFVEKTGHL